MHEIADRNLFIGDFLKVLIIAGKNRKKTGYVSSSVDHEAKRF